MSIAFLSLHLLSWDRASHCVAWASQIWLECLAIKLLGPSCLVFPERRSQTHTTIPSFLHRGWGPELRTSCLCASPLWTEPSPRIFSRKLKVRRKTPASRCLFGLAQFLLEAWKTYFQTGVAGVFLNLFFFFKPEELLSSEEMSALLFKFPEIRGRTYCQTMPLHFKTSAHKLLEDILLKVCKVSY